MMKIKEGELKMKKLLVLLMVLGLATSAQAALTLSLSETTVAVGDTVTASVVSDSATPWGYYLFILSEDTYYWTDPVAAAYDGSWSYHTTAGAGSVGDLGYATTTTYAAAYRLNADGSSVFPEAGTQFSISLMGVQAGTIYISLQNPSDYSEMTTNGPLALEVVVPEPMTIALLGLGGLFLRRRK
jgi:hypothetical protein